MKIAKLKNDLISVLWSSTPSLQLSFYVLRLSLFDLLIKYTHNMCDTVTS